MLTKQTSVKKENEPSKGAKKAPKSPKSPSKQNKKITTIVIHYDVGYENQLFIRGNGAELSWDKGILLKNIQSNEWIWETTASFDEIEFKVLINDSCYEQGANHQTTCGSTLHYSPDF